MSNLATFWLQIATIAVSPVLALAGVGVGVKLTNSGEQRQWLRDARLQAYTAFLLACNTYDISSRQLEESLKSGARADQVSARDEALRSLGDVITCQERVLLLGSRDVQRDCAAATDAVYARNENVRRMLAGSTSGNPSDQGADLRSAVEIFRATVRSEVLPKRLSGRSSGS